MPGHGFDRAAFTAEASAGLKPPRCWQAVAKWSKLRTISTAFSSASSAAGTAMTVACIAAASTPIHARCFTPASLRHAAEPAAYRRRFARPAAGTRSYRACP
jgi:hypothetical protein